MAEVSVAREGGVKSLQQRIDDYTRNQVRNLPSGQQRRVRTWARNMMSTGRWQEGEALREALSRVIRNR